MTSQHHNIIKYSLKLVSTHFADDGEDLHVFLVSQERDAACDVSNENEVLGNTHLMDVDLCVDEGDSLQVSILQTPDVNLRKTRNTFFYTLNFIQNVNKI